MALAVLYLGLTLFSFMSVLAGLYLVRPFTLRHKEAARWFTAAGIAALVWLGATLFRLFTTTNALAFLGERVASFGLGCTILFFTLSLMALHPRYRRWTPWLFLIGIAYHGAINLYLFSLPRHIVWEDWGGFRWFHVERANPWWLKGSWLLMTLGMAFWAGWLYYRLYGQALRYRPWYLQLAVYVGLLIILGSEFMEAIDVPPFDQIPDPLPLSFWALYGLLAWGMLRTKYGVTAAFSPQGVFRRLHQGILVFNNHDLLVEWNPAAASMLGLQESHRGMSFEQLSQQFPWMQKLKKDHQTLPHLVKWNKKGQQLLLEIVTGPLTDERGAPLGWLLVVWDVTERHRMETLIHFRAQSEVLYRYLMALGIRPLSPQQVLEQGTAWIYQALHHYHLQGLALYIRDDRETKWHRLLALGTAGEQSPAFLTPPGEAATIPQQIDEAVLFPLVYGDRVFGYLWARWESEAFLPVEETLVQAVEILAHLYAAKREEGRLRLLQQVYANMSDAVFLFDSDFRLVEANPAAHTLCGHNVAYGHAYRFSEIFHGASREDIRRALSEKGYWQGKLDLRRPDGEMRTVDAVITQLRHPNRDPTLVLVARDVTEQEALQQEVGRQRERLVHLLTMAHQTLAAPLRVRDLLEAVAHTARTTTGATHFALVLLQENAEFEDVFLYGELPSQLSIHTIRDWARQALQPGNLLERVLKRKRPVYLADIRRLSIDPTFLNLFPWRSIMLVPLYHGPQPLALLIVGSTQPFAFDHQSRLLIRGMAEILALGLRHVQLYATQERLARERLKAREEEARLRYQQERFLANVSHELRTPLQAILGYLEWIRMSTRPDTSVQDIQEELQEIDLAAHHMLRLVTQLLDFQKAQTQSQLVVRTFRIQDMVDDLLPLVRPLMEHNQNTLDVHIEPPDLEMYSDASKITHILLNLLSNAAKFTHQGRVTLDIRQETDAQGKAWVVMRVSDTGIGIPDHALEHIFKPFAQADESIAHRYGGTGLGLSLAREYARWLGGDITVQSEVGKGSTFTVRLPRSLETGATPASGNTSTSPPSETRKFFFV